MKAGRCSNGLPFFEQIQSIRLLFYGYFCKGCQKIDYSYTFFERRITTKFCRFFKMYEIDGKMVQKMKNNVNKVFCQGLISGGILLLAIGVGSASASVNTDNACSLNPDDAPPSSRMPPHATLSWVTPTHRVDGTQLSPYDVESYEIRYGQDQASLNCLVIVDDVSGLTGAFYLIENLFSGSWYFTIQTRDVGGLLSLPSDVVSKNVPG